MIKKKKKKLIGFKVTHSKITGIHCFFFKYGGEGWWETHL